LETIGIVGCGIALFVISCGIALVTAYGCGFAVAVLRIHSEWLRAALAVLFAGGTFIISVVFLIRFEKRYDLMRRSGLALAKLYKRHDDNAA
jgi:hypothetical protein